MNPLETAFLKAILDAPGDPVPALIYADWLEEQGRVGEAALVRWCCSGTAYQPVLVHHVLPPRLRWWSDHWGRFAGLSFGRSSWLVTAWSFRQRPLLPAGCMEDDTE